MDGLLMDALDEVESDVLLSGMTKCSRRWLPEKSQCESRRGVVLSECHYGADCRQRFPFVAQSEAARVKWWFGRPDPPVLRASNVLAWERE